jgi:hypothetical protein
MQQKVEENPGSILGEILKQPVLKQFFACQLEKKVDVEGNEAGEYVLRDVAILAKGFATWPETFGSGSRIIITKHTMEPQQMAALGLILAQSECFAVVVGVTS